jgi:hypothetical protein
MQANVAGLGQVGQQQRDRVGRPAGHEVVVVDQDETLRSGPPTNYENDRPTYRRKPRLVAHLHRLIERLRGDKSGGGYWYPRTATWPAVLDADVTAESGAASPADWAAKPVGLKTQTADDGPERNVGAFVGSACRHG